MKSLILAALLFLSTNAIANDHVWWGVAIDNYGGGMLTSEFSRHPTSAQNKQACLDEIAAVYKRLSEAGVQDRVTLKCTNNDPSI